MEDTSGVKGILDLISNVCLRSRCHQRHHQCFVAVTSSSVEGREAILWTRIADIVRFFTVCIMIVIQMLALHVFKGYTNNQSFAL
jgi:hypothetical protein